MLKTLSVASMLSTAVVPLRTSACTFFLRTRFPLSASRWSLSTRFPSLPAAEPPVISCWVAQKCPPSWLLPDSSTGKPDSDGLHALRLFPESLIPPVVPQAQPLS